MALFRYLAHVVVIPALLTGCSQSLFDDGAGGGGGSPDGGGDDRPDGAPEPGDPDAGEDPDGGMVIVPDGGGGSDGGGVRPDASLPPRDVCPAPCAGDAFDDFNNEQGGKTGRWRYAEVQPEQPDSPYVNMTDAILPGVVLGWIGTGAEEPTIAFCVAEETGLPCVELKDTITLTTPGNEQGAHHPSLMWTVPADGVYYLSGDWRVSSLAPAVQTTMRFTVNSHSNIIDTENVTLTTAPSQFSIEVVVAAGDTIVLSAIATTAESVSVGVNLFITGPY
ncbi:MAG TPA: hypothetical protein VNM90_28680 [Haliangium sp.]|nr:hypothetical protein [Haliangium sp.]